MVLFVRQGRQSHGGTLRRLGLPRGVRWPASGRGEAATGTRRPPAGASSPGGRAEAKASSTARAGKAPDARAARRGEGHDPRPPQRRANAGLLARWRNPRLRELRSHGKPVVDQGWDGAGDASRARAGDGRARRGQSRPGSQLCGLRPQRSVPGNRRFGQHRATLGRRHWPPTASRPARAQGAFRRRQPEKRSGGLGR